MDLSEKLTVLKERVNTFKKNISQYKNNEIYDEANVRTDFIDRFFELLDWDVRNVEGVNEEFRDVVREDKVTIAGRQKAPDYSFRIGNQRIFFVEAKKPSVNIKDSIDPAYQIRRYGYTARLPVSILTDFEEFSIYDTRIKPSKNDKSTIGRIFYCRFEEYEKHFEFIYNTFSKNSVRKGSIKQYLEGQVGKKGTSEIDKEFLKLIEGWRNELAKNIAINNKKLNDIDQLNYAVQKIIDRIIFLRMAEDKEIELYETLLNYTKEKKIYTNIIVYFDKANKKYNSELFKKEEFLDTLKIDDDILTDIISSLYYPDCPYALEVLPTEILGNIYEQFLGKTIRLTAGHQAKVEEKPEVRKAGGVYYTPQYIVEYIVANTIGEKIKDKTPKEISQMRFLDPACGSGSFLIGTYQYLIRYHLQWYTRKENIEKALKEENIFKFKENSYHLTIQEKQNILLNNVYGVDIDRQAVEVTKLSLVLKLLEGENQESTGKLFKHSDLKLLPNLSNNIKCGNSLIGSDYYNDKNLNLFGKEEMKNINVFDWNKEFPEIFKNGGFDCVIGNPPYVVLSSEYYALNYFKNIFLTPKGGKVNLYKLFIEKSICLLKKIGLLGFICPSNYLSSKDSQELRKLILDNIKIKEIIEYTESDKVFKNVTQALTTIIFQKEKVKNNYFNLKTAKHGGSQVNQASFLKNDGYEFICTNSVINKIQMQRLTFDDIFYGFQGEINVSTNKNLFTNKKYNDYLPLIRGNLISSYKLLEEPSEYCPIQADKRGHWNKERVIFQEVSNQQQKRRIKAILQKNEVLCGHTTNYCFAKDDNYNNYEILGLLNSKLINYYFSYFNNTNHVPIGEVKKVPVPDISIKQKEKFISLINLMLDMQNNKEIVQQKIDILNNQIDQLIYKLYDLTEEEIKIVEESFL